MLNKIFHFYWPIRLCKIITLSESTGLQNRATAILRRHASRERGDLCTCAVHIHVRTTLRTKAKVEQGAL